MSDQEPGFKEAVDRYMRWSTSPRSVVERLITEFRATAPSDSIHINPLLSDYLNSGGRRYAEHEPFETVDEYVMIEMKAVGADTDDAEEGDIGWQLSTEYRPWVAGWVDEYPELYSELPPILLAYWTLEWVREEKLTPPQFWESESVTLTFDLNGMTPEVVFDEETVSLQGFLDAAFEYRDELARIDAIGTKMYDDSRESYLRS